MALRAEDMVQRGHPYAIVDEVDSILIDEARTPLIISEAADQPTRWYTEFAKIAGRLRREADYEVDEEANRRHPPGRASNRSRTGWASTTSTRAPTRR